MKKAGKPQTLRQHNTLLIQHFLMENGPVTKPELVQLTRLSLPTVNHIVDELMESNFAIEGSYQKTKSAGRRAMTYMANARFQTYIMMYYLEGRWICSLADMSGDMIWQERIPAEVKETNQLDYFLELLDKCMLRAENPSCISIGIPGVVTPEQVIQAIPMLPDFENCNLQDLLWKRYQLPVLVENDVKLMASGYYAEKMEQSDNLYYLYIGGGIGASILLNGQIYSGNSSFAGEFGYMILPQGGKDRACLKGRTFEERIWEARRLMRDPEAREWARRQMIEDIAIVLVNSSTVLNPDVVVLDCHDLEEGDLISIREILCQTLPSACVPKIQLIRGNGYGVSGLLYESIRYRKTEFQL